FARNGVLFRSVLAQCSWTRPSVGSILTSLYPRTLGLYTKGDEILADRFETLAEVLQAHRYLTVGITSNPNLNTAYNFQQGFDHYIDSDIVYDWMRPQSGQEKLSTTARMKSAPEVFEIVMDILTREKTRPFFLFAHLNDTHLKMDLEIDPEFRDLFGHYSRENERVYYRKIRQASSDVGRFVNKLLAEPGCENTLVIISADHGEGLFDHPRVPNSTGHGYLLYESHLRVPLIFYHPAGGLGPRRIDQEVRLIDLLPTILDYVNIPHRPEDIVGRSLRPLLEGTETSVRLPEYFVAETRTAGWNRIAVYSRNWMYIENRDRFPMLNRFELQSRYRKQNGRFSDLISLQPEAAAPLKEFLTRWEKTFPDGEVTRAKEKASRETLEQLRSLGYIK
ncbi:MAG: sulfatase, partial [Candidatus Aminicenantes bacterium]|nr:sulfatase [Candidatus Aminicenantes bacterium]